MIRAEEVCDDTTVGTAGRMAQMYAPSRTTSSVPVTAIAGLAAVVGGGLIGMVWALVHSPVVLLVWLGAAALFWGVMFSTASDEE